MKPNTPWGVCLYCGAELKRYKLKWRCTVCGEVFDPDEVGFPEDTPPNIYRGEALVSDEKAGKGKTWK